MMHYHRVEGRAKRFYNMELFEKKLEAVLKRARDNPPQFYDEQERKETENLVRFLIAMVEVYHSSLVKTWKVLLQEAELYSAAYYLQLPQAYDTSNFSWSERLFNTRPKFGHIKAPNFYEQALLLGPDEGEVHWRYGVFLCSTTQDKLQKGIQHLKKASDLGIQPALYSLGVVYFKTGDQKQALSYLEKYLECHPYDGKTIEIIMAIKKTVA